MASGPEIERRLPGWLNAKLLSRLLWLWCIALLPISLVLVLGSLFSRLLKPLLNAVANRFLGTTEIDAVQGLVGPLRIVLLGILVFIGSGYAYTLLRRHFWNDVGYVLIIFAATLLSMRVVGIACNLRTPDMGGRKPVRFLGFRARLRPRNASPIPCRGTWCESRSSPRKAFRGLAIDAAN